MKGDFILKMKRLFLLIVALIIVLSTFTACDGSNYKKAVKLMDSGNYEEAKAIFAEIKDYKDSAELINECDYRRASDLLESGDYLGAKEIFTSLGDYEESKTRIQDCNWEIVLDYYNNTFRVQKDGVTFEISAAKDNKELNIFYNIETTGNSSGYMNLSMSYAIERRNPIIIINEELKSNVSEINFSTSGTANVDLVKYKITDNLDWDMKKSLGIEEVDLAIIDLLDTQFKTTYLLLEESLKQSELGITFKDLGIG